MDRLRFGADQSRTSTTFVRKKAALTLLRLYRKHPSVLPLSDWAPRIISMIDDQDPAVALTGTTLVTAMCQDNLDIFSSCYQRAARRLDRVCLDARRSRETRLTGQIVFEGDYPVEYVYYKVSPVLVIREEGAA